MGEIQRIQDQVRRAYEGNAWHGPAIRELLADVTAKRAAARPLSRAHSIWEIVLHISAWNGAVRRRLEGQVIVELPKEEDWPPVRDTTEEAWKRTLHELERAHWGLREMISRLDEVRLGEIVPGKDYSVYVMVHGVVQHDLYHAGQIALLKKAQG